MGDEISSVGLGHGANSTKVVGSIPIQAVYLRVGLDHACGSIQLRISCESINKSASTPKFCTE